MRPPERKDDAKAKGKASRLCHQVQARDKTCEQGPVGLRNWKTR